MGADGVRAGRTVGAGTRTGTDTGTDTFTGTVTTTGAGTDCAGAGALREMLAAETARLLDNPPPTFVTGIREIMQKRDLARNNAYVQGRLYLYSLGVSGLLFLVSVVMLSRAPSDTGIAIVFSFLLVVCLAGMAWFAREARRLHHFLKRDGDKGIL